MKIGPPRETPGGLIWFLKAYSYLVRTRLTYSLPSFPIGRTGWNGLILTLLLKPVLDMILLFLWQISLVVSFRLKVKIKVLVERWGGHMISAKG